jgi:hypothetical protein
MTTEEAAARLCALGFHRWQRDEQPDVLLVPESLHKHVPSEVMLTSIRGIRQAAGEVDLDTRRGLLAWGVVEAQYVEAVGWFEDA